MARTCYVSDMILTRARSKNGDIPRFQSEMRNVPIPTPPFSIVAANFAPRCLDLAALLFAFEASFF